MSTFTPKVNICQYSPLADGDTTGVASRCPKRLEVVATSLAPNRERATCTESNGCHNQDGSGRPSCDSELTPRVRGRAVSSVIRQQFDKAHSDSAIDGSMRSSSDRLGQSGLTNAHTSGGAARWWYLQATNTTTQQHAPSEIILPWRFRPTWWNTP